MSAFNVQGKKLPVGEVIRSGLGAPLILLALLAMVVVPLPPLILDALFSFNISISLIVVLAVIYVSRPLELTIFPSVLLLATLLRLALNVASTRVILLHGHDGPGAAGHVIEAFGQFVVGGNFGVGIVVFAILTIINFIVITKGSSRISEVSARFTLDAMPGKQMAIDADLNAGVLTREEAKAKREEVREEADFYGSMDGASKFVRGDAIAGLLILFVNLIGGLAVGVLQHDMPVGEAAKVYTLLSIGDGLVAQLPALLVSTAVAILVTRVSRSQDLGRAMVGQVFGQQKALIVAAAIIALMGITPGMPHLAFLSISAVLAYLAWKKPGVEAEQAAQASASTQAANETPTELSWEDLTPVDPLGLELGYRLVPLVSHNGSELLSRIKGIRKKLTQQLGFLIPSVHIRDNLELTPTSYRILIHGVPVASGEVHPDRDMALDPGRVYGQIDGLPGRDPAFGMEARWILPAQRGQAENLGYTVVDPATVIATHLAHIVREQAADLLGHEEVQQLLTTVGRSAPKLIEDLTPRALPMAVIVRVLQNLLIERVAIRQPRRIFEALLEQSAQSQDPVALTAAARSSLGRFIVQEINGLEPELPVFTLSPALERLLQEAFQSGTGAIEPGLADRLQQGLNDCVRRQEAAGKPAVLLVPGVVRSTLSRLFRHSLPQLSVLAYHEVPEDKRLHLVGSVG